MEREEEPMATEECREVVIVESEEDFLKAMGNPSGPVTVIQRSVEERQERLLHRVYDGVEAIPVEEEVVAMGLREASKVIARLKVQQVRVDHSITAMALVGMFPVAKEME